MMWKTRALALVLTLGCVGGCMDLAKLYEVQAKQQNALVVSVTDKINWENVAATLNSQLNNPRLTISALYCQGVVIDVITNGVSSELSVASQGSSDAPNTASTTETIEQILRSPLPTSIKEALIVEWLAQLLEGPGTPASQPAVD